MLQFTCIGNLGSNAELHTENGNTFVSFKLAHNERYTRQDGSVVDKTSWVSCIMNGDGRGIMEYLTKGQLVYVCGDGEVRTYHSQQQRCMVAGINIRVRQIQLLGSRPDAVPRTLFDTDGVQVDVTKHYFAGGKKSCELSDRQGNIYKVDAAGWVTAPQPQQAQPQQAQQSEYKGF